MLSEKTGSFWFIRESWRDKSKPMMLKTQKKITDLLDLFENSENIHNKREGIVVQLEQEILEEAMSMAMEFVETLRKRGIQMNHRITASKISQSLSVKPISLTFPDVINKQVMSYLPAVYRLDNLRQKYDYTFLMEGLKKKTIPRINDIFKNFLKTAKAHLVYMTRQKDAIVGPFSVHNPDCLYFLGDIANDWTLATVKMEKIEVILTLYRQLELTHIEKIIKKTVYNDLCQKMITILHSLVIALKPSPKKPRVKKVKVEIVESEA
jgi:hypothetical protein